MIRQGTIVYDGVSYGSGFQTGHYALIRENVTIGDNCSIGSFTEIGPYCKIGDGVRIHSRCFVPEYTEIEDGAWLGPGVIITNTPHPLCEHAKECLKVKRVRIGQGVIIGAGALIMPGVRLFPKSIIGAGAVVTRDVFDEEVLIGLPAKHKKWRNMIVCTLDSDLMAEAGVEDGFKPYPAD